MSEWIEHVKKVSAQKKISYKEAMKIAKASYKPKGKKQAPAKGKGKNKQSSAPKEMMDDKSK